MRVRLALVLSLVAALAVPVAHASAARDGNTTSAGLSPAQYTAGRNLYRKYCGQCHALKAARAVGFGQDKLKTDPGPAFNTLRVPTSLSVSAVVLSTIGGHETIQHRMTWKEIYGVARWLDQVTKGHPILAKITGGDFTGG